MKRIMTRNTLWLVCLLLVTWDNHCGFAQDASSGDAAVAATNSPLTDEQLRERGQAIYVEQCADCHGQQGEGVESAYAKPLTGDDSLGELASVITETMPEDDPTRCEGTDADAVAAYIHYAFYSEAAQIRNRPPRVALSRLTAKQLQQSISDLYAKAAQGLPPVREERGVKGIYFAGSRWKDENKKIDRIDNTINFDFGKESPGEGISPEEFYIYWEGGIKADVSGRYEIIVRSTCSFVMNFGRLNREFINNHVQSGDKTEFRRVIELTAGRVYPFKIDFIQRKRLTEQPPASISLSWIPPSGAEQIIPVENLLPGWTAPGYALQASLPPDDRSYGYERGIAVSRDWDEATTVAAIEFSQICWDELWPHYSRQHSKEGKDEREMLKGFLTELATTAFRGEMNDELRRVYVDAAVDSSEDHREAVRRAVLMIIKSPRFLYPTLDSKQSVSQQAANRLALVLHDGLPIEDWLMKQVAKNELETEQQVREAASRMMDDYRTRAKTDDMIREWLSLSQLKELVKDDEQYSGFDAAVVNDLQRSLMALVNEIIWSEASDYRQLFLADWTYSSKRLAEFYGDQWRVPEEATSLTKTDVSGNNRFGVLTHPLLMSSLAYHDTSSPIHRGVFVIRNLLGRTLRPPMDAFAPLSPDLHPNLTTRERVALQTSPESCQVCHVKINSLGFALENFDAAGRFRTEELGQAIDPSSIYVDRRGETIEFNGPAELAHYLATSQDAQEAFVRRVFQHFVKQPIAAYGDDTLEKLTTRFRESGYHLRKLMIEVAVIAAFEDPSKSPQESNDGPTKT